MPIDWLLLDILVCAAVLTAVLLLKYKEVR